MQNLLLIVSILIIVNVLLLVFSVNQEKRPSEDENTSFPEHPRINTATYQSKPVELSVQDRSSTSLKINKNTKVLRPNTNHKAAICKTDKEINKRNAVLVLEPFEVKEVKSVEPQAETG